LLKSVHGARNISAKKKDGTNDAKCKISIENQNKITKISKKAIDPAWEESFKLYAPPLSLSLSLLSLSSLSLSPLPPLSPPTSPPSSPSTPRLSSPSSYILAFSISLVLTFFVVVLTFSFLLSPSLFSPHAAASLLSSSLPHGKIFTN
jgi:C2 domain